MDHELLSGPITVARILGCYEEPIMDQIITPVAQGLRPEGLLTVEENGLTDINEW